MPERGMAGEDPAAGVHRHGLQRRSVPDKQLPNPCEWPVSQTSRETASVCQMVAPREENSSMYVENDSGTSSSRGLLMWQVWRRLL